MDQPAGGVAHSQSRRFRQVRVLLFALVRSVQLVALLSVLTGLYLGLKNRDMGFELTTLAVGGGLFYLAAYLQRRWL